MIKKYELDLYPVNLWVGTYQDFSETKKKFEFYEDIPGMHANKPAEYVPDVSHGAAVTFIVREKKSTEKGILILINDDFIDNVDFFVFDIVTHETVHATDYIWQLIGAEHNDNVDEPFAYLAGWIAGKIGQYYLDLIKE